MSLQTGAPRLTKSSGSVPGHTQEIELSERSRSREPLSIDPMTQAKYPAVESAVEVPAEEHKKPDSNPYGLPNTVLLENAHQSTRPGNSWWQGQMLVDRSLMIMTATIVWLAVILVIICIALTPKFNKRIGWHSSTTSIPIASGDEAKMKSLCEGIKFIINIAATVILSASNTYQQLLTSLKIEDIRYVLTHFGDSRVGTNSPFAIKHKKSGRAKAWCAWIFLIATSTPVHLLANSVVGVAYYPGDMDYTPTSVGLDQRNGTTGDFNGTQYKTYTGDHDLWRAFRMGAKMNPEHVALVTFGSYSIDVSYAGYCGALNQTALDVEPNPYSETGDSCFYSWIERVRYDENACGALFGTLNDRQEAESESFLSPCYQHMNTPGAIDCSGIPIKDRCTGSDFGWAVEWGKSCGTHKLVVRLLAAVILAACISAKALYMVVTNLRSQSKVKSHCLTFGDVVVAAVLEDIRIPGKCLVNGGDFHRRTVSHTCHKHCRKDIAISATGDEIGHCQKCKKFNSVNNMPNLPWPTLATKSKKSLIANFGQTAVTQMLTLSFTSTGMVAGSIFVGMVFGANYSLAFCAGLITPAKASTRPLMLAQFGGTMRPGLGAEISAFATSNGAQLIYSMLYLLLLYNISLICMEYEWGNFEKGRRRLRCTIVKSEGFEQSYLLQMPAKIMLPIAVYSTTMHWLLGLAIYADEIVLESALRADSTYQVVTVPSALWGSCVLMLGMTTACWWAFTYSREGYIPQMFGSMRAVCSAVSELADFPVEGIMWGDLTRTPPSEMKGAWRHAGLSAGHVDTVIPNELYAGRLGEPHSNPGYAHEELARKKRL
ncbi:hypothetical protein BC567DRAFT_284561 [Phyllosticta citribraziliensis]